MNHIFNYNKIYIYIYIFYYILIRFLVVEVLYAIKPLATYVMPHFLNLIRIAQTT